MKLIVITHPEHLPGEEKLITALFKAGLERLHLRKPTYTRSETEQLLQAIPSEYHSRIVLHDYHTLALQYAMGGIHLNARNPLGPKGYEGGISCSCHSFDDVRKKKNGMDYVFLSPIFDSISKQSYASGYTDLMLREASNAGIIDKKVIALGGVLPERIDYLNEVGFGGAATLGVIWETPTIKGVQAIFKRFLR